MATSQNRQSNLQTAESFATHLHTMVILFRNSDSSTAYNKVFETKLPTTYTEASGPFVSLHPLTLTQERTTLQSYPKLIRFTLRAFYRFSITIFRKLYRSRE